LNIKRVGLLLKREWIRNIRNISFLISLMLPILIIFLNFMAYSHNDILKQKSFSIVLNMNMLSISILVYSIVLISDLEENSYRNILCIGIKYFEIIFSKNIFTLSFLAINQVFISLLYKLTLQDTLYSIIISLLGGLIIQFVVSIICFINKNYNAIGNFNAVIFIILLMIPEIIPFVKAFRYLALFLPSYYSKNFADIIMNIPAKIDIISLIVTIILWVFIPMIYARRKNIFQLKKVTE